MDHVLLATTVRHLNERVQIANGRAQNVTFNTDTNKEEMFATNMQKQTDRIEIQGEDTYPQQTRWPFDCQELHLQEN